MVREYVPVREASGSEAVTPRDYGRWFLVGGYALIAAIGLAALAFAAGYLVALHNLAGIIHTDKATIVHLGNRLQVIQSRRAR